MAKCDGFFWQVVIFPVYPTAIGARLKTPLDGTEVDKEALTEVTCSVDWPYRDSIVIQLSYDLWYGRNCHIASM